MYLHFNPARDSLKLLPGEIPIPLAPVSVVTMLVNPEEAERLTLAASEGKIQLALRIVF